MAMSEQVADRKYQKFLETAEGNTSVRTSALITDDSSNLSTDVIANADDDTNLDGNNGVVSNSVLYSRIDGSSIKPLRMDASTHSIQTINYEHHEIHSGSHYFVNMYEDLAINHVLQFTFVTPDTTKWTHWTWRIDTESETLWQVYEDGSITTPLANSVTPYNNNRNSGNTSGNVLRYEDHVDLANANADVDVSGATLLASGISGAGKTSGADKRENEMVLKQDTVYVLRATATTAGYIDFNMNWYEHTDKD